MRTILNLNSKTARKYLFKPRSYFSLELPSYYRLDRLFMQIRPVLVKHHLEEFYHPDAHPGYFGDINYPLVCNKDGQYAWRKHQLLHPAFYAALVYRLTDRDDWDFFRQRFKSFRHPQLTCASILPAPTSRLSRSEQDIFNWSSNFTDETVRQGLPYRYMLSTDLAHCYDMLPIRLIGEALHGTETYYDSQLFGWQIVQLLQDLSHGQAYGLPQGSALIDTLAEFILAYIDSIVCARLEGLPDWRILRYRDDYRIFANTEATARRVMKTLVETLAEFGLQMNLSKTFLTSGIVKHAYKPDRLAWKPVEQLIFGENRLNAYKSLLQIRDFGERYPNCGSVKAALSQLYVREIYDDECHDDPFRIASVLADIMQRHPGSWPHCIAILSKYAAANKSRTVLHIVDQILARFVDTPHIEYLQIWLQRLSIKANPLQGYSSSFCQIVYTPRTKLWNSTWLHHFPTEFRDLDLIDYEELFTLPTAIPPAEVALFTNIHGSGE